MEDINKYIENKLLLGPLYIEDTGILSGANYFSGGRVIRIRLNLKEYDEVFTNEINLFFEKLVVALPSLNEHFCSYGHKGGFFKRVEEGTLLGHVVEHCSLELQNMIGMKIAFGKTRETKIKGVYNVVFRFIDEVAGLFAGKAAVVLVNSILKNEAFPLEQVIERLIEIKEKRLLGFSTQSIVDEASERGIPCLRLDKYNLVQLGLGIHRKLIRATVTSNTSLIAVETTDNKYNTSQILLEAGIPVPKQKIADNFEEAKNFLNNYKSVVIKPNIGYKGKAVSLDIINENMLEKAFNYCQLSDNEVIIQEQKLGLTFRVLVINHKFSAAVMVSSPYITGNGINTITELLHDLNSDSDRNKITGTLSQVELDEDSLNILNIHEFTPDTILAEGHTLRLKNTANTSLGGASYDVSDKVNDYNKFVCERISHILNLDVAGIDIISPDISLPIYENNGVVIDINAAPDFKIHIQPSGGIPRLVQKDFLNMLFPEENLCKIPIIAVTGSSGKTFFTKILEEYYSQKNIYAGILRSNGLFVNRRLIKSLDLINSDNTTLILKDPTIEAAVVEIPVETILNFGLGYELADIGVVLNHLPKPEYFTYDHVRDEEDLVYAKSVVAEEVCDNGYSILNADYPLIFEMTERLYSNPAFISKKIPNAKIKQYCEKGSSIAYINNNKIVINSKGIETIFSDINDLSIFNNADSYTVDAILASIMVMHLLGESNIFILSVLNNVNE